MITSRNYLRRSAETVSKLGSVDLDERVTELTEALNRGCTFVQDELTECNRRAADIGLYEPSWLDT